MENGQFKIFWITILLNFIVSSCHDCEDRGEPELRIIYSEIFKYKNIYGIGGTGDLEITENLPIAINNDTSTYVFYNDTLFDTLCIIYNREIKYIDKECGFSIELNNFKAKPSNWFDSVRFSIFDSQNNLFYSAKRNLYEVQIFSN